MDSMDFSIDNCFHLTHNDSVIHSTEKIRILALLKNIDVKLCTAKNGHCFFSQLNNSVFSKLNFFQEWMNTRVPKFFIENLNTIDLKLNFEKEKKACVQTNEFSSSNNIDLENKTQAILYHKENNSLYMNHPQHKFIPTKTISPITMNHCQQKNDVKDSNSKFNGLDIEENEEELFEKNYRNLTKRKKHLAMDSGEYDLDCDDVNYTQEFERPPLKSDNAEEKTKQTKKFKNIYCGKPFSIGETLNNLRNAVKDFSSKKDSVEGCNHSSPPKDECAWGKNSNNIDSSLYKEGNVKKRKRIRRSRSKKQKYEELNKPIISSEKIMWNNDHDTSVKEIKSKHIRFNSSSDNSISDINESELKPSKLSSEEKKNSAESFQAIEIVQNENSKRANSFDNTNDKSQNNFNISQNKKSQDNYQNLNTENSVDFENQKFGVEGVENGTFKATESNAKNADFNALMSLKNLFQSPVIIDRF